MFSIGELISYGCNGVCKVWTGKGSNLKRLLLRCGWNKKLYQPETPMCGSITPIQAPAREGDAQPRTNKKAPLCKGSWLREAETEGL